MISQKFAVQQSKNRKDMENIKDILFEILPTLNFKPQPTKGFKGNKFRIDYWLYTFVNCESSIQFEFELKKDVYKGTLDFSSTPEQICDSIIGYLPKPIQNRLYRVQ